MSRLVYARPVLKRLQSCLQPFFLIHETGVKKALTGSGDFRRGTWILIRIAMLSAVACSRVL